MAHYRYGMCSDPRCCYELFHRALGEQDEEAWTAVYDQYHHLVRHWLGNTPGEADTLVNESFERLWRAIPPDRFVKFPTLDKILGYLKHCAQCATIDARRREERKQREEAVAAQMQALGTGGGPISSNRVLDEIVAEQLIECARERCHGPQEQIVFCASFEWDLRPGMIAEGWPDVFADAREVSRIKERILRRLRRDGEMRALVEMDD